MSKPPPPRPEPPRRPPWAPTEPLPNPADFRESEQYVAGRLSAEPAFDQYHPAWALPYARAAIHALGDWGALEANRIEDRRNIPSTDEALEELRRADEEPTGIDPYAGSVATYTGEEEPA